MAQPQSATAPTVLILGGFVLAMFMPLLGGFLVFVGVILLVVRMFAGAANAIKADSAESVVPEQSTKACPFCAETIKREANVCRYCGRDIVESETRVLAPPNMVSAREYATANSVELEGVIQKLRTGDLQGRLIEGEWFVAR
jgi:hypothetical protein